MQDQVSTTLGNRKYTYKYNGAFFTWIDDLNMIAPLLIHTRLREKALSEGADSSIFLSKPKVPRQEVIEKEVSNDLSKTKSEPKQKRNINLGGGFNPFAV